jgi:hypothetical protein
VMTSRPVIAQDFDFGLHAGNPNCVRLFVTFERFERFSVARGSNRSGQQV